MLSLALFAAVLVLISRISIFRGVNERLTSMIASFTGEGAADGSSLLRKKMQRGRLCAVPENADFRHRHRLLRRAFTAHDQQKHLPSQQLHWNSWPAAVSVGTALYYVPRLALLRDFWSSRFLRNRPGHRVPDDFAAASDYGLRRGSSTRKRCSTCIC